MAVAVKKFNKNDLSYTCTLILVPNHLTGGSHNSNSRLQQLEYLVAEILSQGINQNGIDTDAAAGAVAGAASGDAAAASAAASAVCIYYVVIGGALRAPI